MKPKKAKEGPVTDVARSKCTPRLRQAQVQGFLSFVQLQIDVGTEVKWVDICVAPHEFVAPLEFLDLAS